MRGLRLTLTVVKAGRKFWWSHPYGGGETDDAGRHPDHDLAGLSLGQARRVLEDAYTVKARRIVEGDPV